MTGPLTLYDYAQMANNPLVTKVVTTLVDQQSLLVDIPLDTSGSLKKVMGRFDGANVPTPTWVPLNQTPTVTRGRFDHVEASMNFTRDQLQIDKALLNDPNSIGDPMGNQIMMYLKAFSKAFNDNWINNDIATGDVNCFDGIRGRLNKATDYGIPTEFKQALSIDITAGSITSALADRVFREIGLMLSRVGNSDGSGVVIYCNDFMLACLESAARILGGGGGWNVNVDAFDRQIFKFRNATFRNPGTRFPQTLSGSLNRIMGTAETASGAATTGSVYSSLLFVRYGEDAVQGWQNADPANWFIPVGSAPDGIIEKVTTNIGIGIINPSAYDIGMISGVKVTS